jgi:hypothetical protein
VDTAVDMATGGQLNNITATRINERFKEALRSAKDNLEKCKLIVGNPEFVDVLS